jgi:hypothetical protein
MPRNDPTDTGGLFIGRRPGTAPLRYRTVPKIAGDKRQKRDAKMANLLLLGEVFVCLTLWGPQPVAWLWAGSQVDYLADSVVLGLVVAFAGMLATLFLTLSLAARMDYAWKILRRAAGYNQTEGMLVRIFAITAVIAGGAFMFWLFIIEGPGSMGLPGQ